MAENIKQIKEFPNKPDFGDEDLLLIQGRGTTYNVAGSAVKKYAEESAKPYAEAAADSAAESAAAADRSETAVEHPPVVDYETGFWQVWDRASGEYVPTEIRAVGKDFEIKGYYPSLEALEAAVPSPGPGDVYGVGAEPPYDIYVWDAVGGAWKNNGPMMATGDMTRAVYDPQGKRQDIFGYAEALFEEARAADVGLSMAGQEVEPTEGTTVTAGEGAEIFNDYRARTFGADDGYETVVAKRGNVASGVRAHAEGIATTASGRCSHAEGASGIAEGIASHVEGGYMTGNDPNKATGYAAHAEGASTLASGDHSHAEGELTTASGKCSHAEGVKGIAEGTASHVEGGYMTGSGPNKATGYAAHAEGGSTLASGGESHAEGQRTKATEVCAHAEGIFTEASGTAAHAEGTTTVASGYAAHAEGGGCQATGDRAHAEGTSGIAEGTASHVEGGYITGSGPNKATGYAAHAEGASTLASGDHSHAEGQRTIASGGSSHAEGYLTTAKGYVSHAGGLNTIATQSYQTAIGEYNVESSSSIDFFIVGSGYSNARANCFRVTSLGVYASGKYNASGADYAELFEWADGNPEAQDRTGRFVTLTGDRLRLAGPEDGYILGVVSGSPSVVGDVYDDQWAGMFLSDIFGRPVWEDVEIPAVIEEFPDPEDPEKTEAREIVPAHTERRQKLNPAYDNSQKYIPRTERPEWAAVGLLGKLVAVEDGTCQADGWCTAGEGGAATASPERTRFRVMEKLTDPDTGRRCVRILILSA